jgi:hypothetical protein
MTHESTRNNGRSGTYGSSSELRLGPGSGPRAGRIAVPRSGWEPGTARRSSAGPAGLAGARMVEPGGVVRAVRGWWL